eukprot:4290902-Pleurochrysis_carterae.AAC.6
MLALHGVAKAHVKVLPVIAEVLGNLALLWRFQAKKGTQGYGHWPGLFVGYLVPAIRPNYNASKRGAYGLASTRGGGLQARGWRPGVVSYRISWMRSRRSSTPVPVRP